MYAGWSPTKLPATWTASQHSNRKHWNFLGQLLLERSWFFFPCNSLCRFGEFYRQLRLKRTKISIRKWNLHPNSVSKLTLVTQNVQCLIDHWFFRPSLEFSYVVLQNCLFFFSVDLEYRARVKLSHSQFLAVVALFYRKVVGNPNTRLLLVRNNCTVRTRVYAFFAG